MTRVFSIVSVVAALAIGGFMLTSQTTRREVAQATQAVDEAQATASEATFQQAAIALQAHLVDAGTYAGTDLGAYGVSLVRADAASYCIQAGTGTALSHLTGPAGSVAPGPC